VIDEIVHNNKLGISFVPYQHDVTLFPKETQRICIAHQTFLGADFGDYRPDSGVALEDVSAEIIISGHVHKRQTINDKLIYPGTPFAQNAKDVNQDKGLMLFNTATYETKFIPSPFPRWQRISFNLEEQSPSEIVRLAHLFTSKDNWVVDISGPKNEVNSLLANAAFKEVQNLVKIKINTSYTDKQKLSNISIKKTSIKDIANEYIDKVYSGQLSKISLKQALEEIL
jgi:DNA repair exonuclease SbcCD nuclease subunit